jgi:hypothetical protein
MAVSIVLGAALAGSLLAGSTFAAPKTTGTPSINPLSVSMTLAQTTAPVATAAGSACPGTGGNGPFNQWSGGVWSGDVTDGSFMHLYDITHVQLTATKMLFSQNTGSGLFIGTLAVMAKSNADSAVVVSGQTPVTFVMNDLNPIGLGYQASGFINVPFYSGKKSVQMSLLSHIDFTTDASFATITGTIGDDTSGSSPADFGVEWNNQTC